jgi:positive regulator of sigma E activity
MSSDPTKATGRWDIGKSNLLYNLVFLLLVMTVSHLFKLAFISAVLWCLPLIPAWWLVKKLWRRKGERG